ncbi:hypothetical protein [Geosporobacter ferrireducens]|uniref:Uncharacterized protein n=1 Tax=Geosporobacter ferrireducens TaxID=1424294 RepID=A0A1D8GCA2_9FIRM|nr:hypothetical protein [Geosporobacter ferrireducens]AOT68538.1 hypothetical protein Gferi_02375 [Geosporobacter ferrireducens]MTI54004.1 hypothetical protein [Geosporobacter ferrireducens]
MSRVERKEKEKKEKKHPIYRYILIATIFLIIFSGIIIVDEAVRSMLMTEEPKAFGYKKIDATIHQIYFCGQKIYIDEIEVRGQYLQWKADVQDLWKQLKDLTGRLIVDHL